MQLNRPLAEQRARLLKLKQDRNELTVLTRNVETAQRTYEVAMQRAVVSQVESRASQTNVALLNPAIAPRGPSHPRVALNIALSVLVGTMLGIGLAILMELLDRRVRAPSDLDQGQNVPLLAVLNAWRPARKPLLGRLTGTRRALPNLG
jgi:succinoglycan biosynthesis transport protein ExoP